jgi:hypothetical protein
MTSHPALPCSRGRFFVFVAVLAFVGAPAFGQDDNHPPKGFTALFKGRDFDDWTFGRTLSRQALAALPASEREALQKALKDHWRVDKGELVSDGKEPYLATTKDYGDFEMWVDWKIGPQGDSGIYLRGVPQVQIWDPNDENSKKHGCDKGSGALWNNKKGERFPPVLADNPVGDWNRMYIRMVGPYVLVKLNDKTTVDNVVMENYYNPNRPIDPRGPIYLQTHGSETRFRNVFLREIPAAEANRILDEIKGDKTSFQPIFNGIDLVGWSGATDSYEVVDGELRCKAGRGKVLTTDDQYDNFVVRLEFKLPPGGNNGLALRTPSNFDGDAAYEAMEVQILDDDAPKHKSILDYQHCGSLYGLVPAKPGFARPVGKWNFQEVTLNGDHVVVNLNGYEIVNADIAQARENPIDGMKHPGAHRTSGHLGFCGHGDPVAFRNIRVKRLPGA